MPEWSAWGSNRTEGVGADTSDSQMTTITADASADTKGSYTQIVAATAFEASGLLIQMGVANINEYLVDFAVGAAASEQIIVPDLLYGNPSRRIGGNYFINISVPAGSRLAARCQGGTGSDLIDTQVYLLSSNFMQAPRYHRCTTYGADTSDSGGVGIDPGGSANTKGAYSQIVASTTNNIKELLIVIGEGGNSTRSAASWLMDVAIGTGGSEQIIIPDLHFGSSIQGDDLEPFVFGPFKVSIPSGTRLAIAAQCDITDAADRLFDAVIYGVD